MHDDVTDYLPKPQNDANIPVPLLMPGIADHIPLVKPSVDEPKGQVNENVLPKNVNVSPRSVKVSPEKTTPSIKPNIQQKHSEGVITRSGLKSVPPSRLISE